MTRIVKKLTLLQDAKTTRKASLGQDEDLAKITRPALMNAMSLTLLNAKLLATLRPRALFTPMEFI